MIDKIERRAPWIGMPHLLLGILAVQVMFYLSAQLEQFDLHRLMFSWSMVMAGEWWRVVTFLFYPPGCPWYLFAFGIACTYFLGSSLEREWGTFRFNLFLLTGWWLTIGVGLLVPTAVLSNVFIAGSILLAFAFYAPDFEFRLYFIFPVRAKYLALLSLVYSTLAFIFGGAAEKLAVVAALGNYLLFFGRPMWGELKAGHRQFNRRSKLRADLREAAAAGPRHQCAACAKNSDTHPEEDFRYSADDRCYCAEHRPKKPVATSGSATS